MARKGKRDAASGYDAADQDQQNLHGGAAVETAAPGADAQTGVLAGGVHAPEGEVPPPLPVSDEDVPTTDAPQGQAAEVTSAPPDFEAEVAAFEAQLAAGGEDPKGPEDCEPVFGGVPIAETREQFMCDLGTFGIAAMPAPPPFTEELAAWRDHLQSEIRRVSGLDQFPAMTPRPLPLTEDMALWCAYRAARAVVSAMRGDQIDDAMLARMYPNFATAGLLAAFIRQNRDAPIQALTVHAYGPRYPSFFDLPPLEQFAWTVFHDTFRAHMRLLG